MDYIKSLWNDDENKKQNPTDYPLAPISQVGGKSVGPGNRYQVPPHPNIFDQNNPYLPNQKYQGIMTENDNQISERIINNQNYEPLRDHNQPVYLPTNYVTVEQKMVDNKFGIIIKQEYELLKTLQMCEDHYAWSVYQKDHEEKRIGKPQFKFSLRAGFYEQCLIGGCRPLNMKAYNQQYNDFKEDVDTVCLKCYKDCKCTFCCANRQSMTVNYSEQSTRDIQLGTIQNPYSGMGLSYQISDELGKVNYHIIADCCQIYFWCLFHCADCCNQLQFGIYENKIVTDKNGNLHNEPDMSFDVGKIYKASDDYGRVIMADFPKSSNWRDRVLIMTAAVELDYIYHGHLEESPQDKAKKAEAKARRDEAKAKKAEPVAKKVKK